MGDFTEKKFQSMVDEMTRFEEEIGMPYKPELDVPHPLVSRPFVIGTNTFSQAQRKILQIHDGVPINAPMFVPPQIMHAGPIGPVPGGIPPPPPPPMSAPPAGMTFPPRLSMPFGQTIPPPPQPPAFIPSMMMRSEPAVPAAPPVSTPSTVSFPRRPTAPTWPVKTTPAFRPPTPPRTEPEPKPVTDSPPKVVLSATPKLYTPKVESYEEMNYSNFSTRITLPEPPRPAFMNRKPKPEPPKFTPVVPVDIYSQTAPKKDKKKKKVIRVSGGQTWEDPTLTEWEDGDFRLFCGDLGNDVTDELLTRIFCKYPSFVKARVVRDKRTNKTKGYGFISFKDPQDFIRASKEMNGRYVGSRPIKLRKSTWKNRNLDSVKKKEKEKAALIALLTGKS